MDKRAYWIWLQHAFGAGSNKPWQIYRRFNAGIEEFYSGKSPLWNSMKFVSEKEGRMLSVFTLQQAEILLETCEKLGHKVITPEDKVYPEALRNIFNPPAVLYYRGNLPNVDSVPAVAMVGTRKAVQKSLDAATTISYQLAISGATVISGGALGVDSASHRGAMRGMGKTIAVLPCGLMNGYLVENHALREKIVENGALITEYPMDTGVTKGTFQVRNRLISGLSCATLIVEAGVKSGALITAKHAKEQDRDVFVYIGDMDAKEYSGCKSLFNDGAKIVTKGDDILEEYQHRFIPVKKLIQPIKKVYIEPAIAAVSVMSDSKNEGEFIKNKSPKSVVLENLSHEPMHISEIENKTKLLPSQILAVLTELELEDVISTFSGRRYSLK